MATIEEIKNTASLVRNATQIGENTAERVGSVLEGLADIAKQQDSKLSDLADNTEIRDEKGTTIKTPFREIESPEFLHCIVDANYKFIFGIQLDGTIEWSVGIPAPIRKRLQEIINQSQQDKTDVLEAINTVKEELAASITALQKGKVDKEEGKSLIEDEVKECFRVIENEEYIMAVVDSEDRVLFGLRRDTGKPYYPFNEMYHVIQNKEFFALWLDADDKILLGIRRDGQIIGEIHAVNALKQVISQIQADVAALQEKVGTIDTNLKELLDVFSLQENEEYLAVEKDAEGKILSSTNADGSHYIHNAKSETIPTEFEHIEDPEGRTEITTDAEDKVMSFRDSQGKKHEHDMEVANLEVSNLNLKGNSVNNIQDALKANGFDVKTPVDWSDSSFIQIPEPRFAIINITNIDSMPTTKQDNKHAYLEFWDMQGNYFKKRVIANAQGSSSMAYPKKNVAIDICDDEWIGDITAKIRIGNWVPQDSFHLKAFYTDFFRGVSPVSYKLYEQMVNTRGNMYNRPWKKALIDISNIDNVTKTLGNPYVGDFSLLTDTGARCVPDGFPIALYLNGAFYGVFSWQLKKHRDNYHMNKATAEHIHLDGKLDAKTIFNGRNNIDWTWFEIRNPKNLYAIGGNKYNADIAQEEIAGDEEIATWIGAGQLPDGTAITSKIKKNLQLTAKVKNYIMEYADAIPTIKAAREVYNTSGKTEEDLQTFKNVYEKYFDKDNIIDYEIFSDVTDNLDGFSKNWQMITYNGIKWWILPYDCDCTYGAYWSGDCTDPPLTKHLNDNTNMPIGLLNRFYTDELESRYKALADKKVISAENIISNLLEWTMRIGTSFYEEEYKKWKDSPCISDSIVRSAYWKPKVDDNGEYEVDTQETFDATKVYNEGDVVSFGIMKSMGYFKFECVAPTVAQEVNRPHTISDYSPIKGFRHCDNIYRIQKWIIQNISNMDKLYNYSRN